MPELFPILRVMIDKNPRPGQFLLLGSATPDLRRQSAESLAGRLMTIELTPFTAVEAVPISSSIERNAGPSKRRVGFAFGNGC